ncbi:MAG: formylmethanofuran dehydrogenase [Deltaproteobacteria bacterium]|nr:formylmethanofuran dehydrogenase [Deltaproteobacteria bacterium]MBW2152407.1 formylmethanofuran dehydrogenase [Deltaproteobacteria bacterium]
MELFEVLLKKSAEAHGHLCPGQAVGVRMAMLGCRLIGLEEPTRHDQIKKLIVYVEMDRCAADAIAHVTGVKLGRRSLKYVDYGIMAATFLNLQTNKAFRVISTEEARELSFVYAPEIAEKHLQQLEAYKRMPDSVLFKVQEVTVSIEDTDLPGPTRRKVACRRCGQVVRDGREVIKDGYPLCRPCFSGAYFYDAREISLPEINREPNWSSQPSAVSR